MSIAKKPCENCGQEFDPAPSQQTRQRFCPRKKCQRERHRLACRAFRRANPDHDDGRRAKIREWAAKKEYWAKWRGEHPDYCRRDNTRRKRAHRAAKRDARRPVLLEELRKIQAQEPECAAKRDAWDPRVDELLVWLIRKETPQTETLELSARK